MRHLPIYLFFTAISLFCIDLKAQTDTLQIVTDSLMVDKDLIEDSIEVKDIRDSAAATVTDSLSVKRAKRIKKIFLGVDAFSPLMSFLSDKKGFQFMGAFHLNNKWAIATEVGYESNIFDDIDWDVDVNGVYIRLGVNYYFTQDKKEPANGFYTGARVSYSRFKQTVNQYPIRNNYNQELAYGSLEEGDVSSYWLELIIGGRVELISNFYAEFSLRPIIYLGSQEQENIKPLVIPGYGKDAGPINFTVIWGLSYQLPF